MDQFVGFAVLGGMLALGVWALTSLGAAVKALKSIDESLKWQNARIAAQDQARASMPAQWPQTAAR